MRQQGKGINKRIRKKERKKECPVGEKSDKRDLTVANLTDVQFEGIKGNDCPDFSDAYVVSARFRDSDELLNDDELDRLNEDSYIVYEILMEFLF